MNATRTAAKTINFLNLYGGGLAALAMKLFASETNMSQTTLHAIYMVKYLRNCPFAKPEQIEEMKRLPPDRRTTACTIRTVCVWRRRRVKNSYCVRRLNDYAILNNVSSVPDDSDT